MSRPDQPIKYHELITTVQDRLELPTQGEAVRATRAVLTPLGERIQPEEANNLASPLPMEIDRFLREADSDQRSSFEEYLGTVSEIEDTDTQTARRHAQDVVAILSEIVPSGELKQVHTQLPADFDPLFDHVDEAVFAE